MYRILVPINHTAILGQKSGVLYLFRGVYCYVAHLCMPLGLINKERREIAIRGLSLLKLNELILPIGQLLASD